MTSSTRHISFTPAFIPVRRIDYRGNLTVRYLYPDGTEPQVNALSPDPEVYPATNIADDRYKVNPYDSVGTKRKKAKDNLEWLSIHKPFLFEELLVFLEGIPEDEVPLVSSHLTHTLTPERIISEEYIETYYRVMFQTSPLCAALAVDGFNVRDKKNAALFIFSSARVACGYTVIHPHFRAAILAVWITQEHFDFPRAPILRDHAEDLAFIDSRFDEVYASRHELMRRGTINKSSIEEFLRNDGPLRLGAL